MKLGGPCLHYRFRPPEMFIQIVLIVLQKEEI